MTLQLHVDYLCLTRVYGINFLSINWVLRLQYMSGLLIFRGKKSKISRDFQGQIRGKIGRFRGIFAGRKSKFAEKSADFWYFFRKKVKIRRKIGRFRGIFAEKSQISKDFQRQILRKIGRFHGKFRGETLP